ncbi:MAG: SDR family oxidoreductase [Fulvivirga sp.]
MTKLALILGGTSDISIALAKDLLVQGYSILLAGRNTEALNSIAADLEIRFDGSVRAIGFDATDYLNHRTFIEGLPSMPELTIAVFGYLGDQEKAQSDWQECERILDTNYKGAVSILNIVAKTYEDQKRGTIVGISSVAGERGRQSNYFYGSAKAGFTAYLSGLRNRLFKSGVNVLTVKPGFVDTKMTANMDLPGPLTATPEKVSKSIIKAIRKNKSTIYTLSIWRLIMYIIKTIPEFIFKRLKL